MIDRNSIFSETYWVCWVNCTVSLISQGKICQWLHIALGLFTGLQPWHDNYLLMMPNTSLFTLPTFKANFDASAADNFWYIVAKGDNEQFLLLPLCFQLYELLLMEIFNIFAKMFTRLPAANTWGKGNWLWTLPNTIN